MGFVLVASEANWISCGLFLSINALETGIEAFSNTRKIAKIARKINRPCEAIKHFPDLCDILTEKHWIRRWWQQLNRLTNLNHKHIREILPFEIGGWCHFGSWKFSPELAHAWKEWNWVQLGKAIAMVEWCLQDQFRRNDVDAGFWHYYKSSEGFIYLEVVVVIPVSGNEVRNIIRNLKRTKAPGQDGVISNMN